MSNPTIALKMKLHKIFYDEPSRALVGEGFIPLDNTNGKEGWFEFWPILSFLEQNTLEDEVWYGFFSPKFPEKALVTLTDVTQLLSRNPKADVALFTFDWTSVALARNPWDQGEWLHPGLIACFERFLAVESHSADLAQAVLDFKTTVFSNYIVAKKPFWEAWRDLARKYLNYTEAGGSDLQDNQTTEYDREGVYPLRVFVQERLASWVLITHPFQVVHPDYVRSMPMPEWFPGRESRLLRMTLYLCERCKFLYRRSNLSVFLFGFLVFRRVSGWINVDRRHGQGNSEGS